MSTNTIIKRDFTDFVHTVRPQRGLAFGFILLTALLAFELFNYSTTEYALTDLLGDLEFLSVRWATILAIAFCGIDFAGIARLFTPQKEPGIHNEAWYLFGAWLLAATMNAMLTWWGVSLAVINHQTLGNAIIERQLLLRAVPIFVAVMIWLIRVLIIGSFSVAGDQIMKQSSTMHAGQTARPRINPSTSPVRSFSSQPRSQQAISAKPKNTSNSQPVTAASESNYRRPEPTYHPLSMSPTRNMNSNNTSQSSRQTPPPQYHG
jgi:hypothetical protein